MQLKEKILQNLKDTITLIKWNEKNGIKVFRLSSELFPHKSNPKVEDYTFDFAIELLKQIGCLARKFNHRLTFHPGQYNVVGTPNEKMFKQTCEDLKYHADVLDLMGMGDDSVMVVHGGGLYGDKEKKRKKDGVNNFICYPKMFKKDWYSKIVKNVFPFKIAWTYQIK